MKQIKMSLGHQARQIFHILMDTSTNQYDGEGLLAIEALRQDMDAYIDRHRPLGNATPSIVTQHLQYLDDQYAKYEAQLRLLLLQSRDCVETQTYLDFAYDIRVVIRDVYYEQSGKEVWDLPPMSAELHSTSWDSSFSHARTLVAARLDWVLTHRAVDQVFDPHPSYNRYEDLGSTDDEADVRQRLPREYSWLVDFSTRPSLEWVVFFQHVARLTTIETGVHHFIVEVRRLVRASTYGEPKQDVDILMERANAEDGAKCEDSCDICGHDFADSLGNQDADGDADNEAEVAVRTICGHVFGRSCLENWVRTCTSTQNKITCPTCREGLRGGEERGLEGQLFAYPEEVAEALHGFGEARRAAARYNHEIHEFLIWGMYNFPTESVSGNPVNVHNKPYEPEIGDFLHCLESARRQLDRSIDRVRVAVRHMLGPAYADESEHPLHGLQL